MDERYLTIALRLLHIIGGVLWVGAVAALAWFIYPARTVLGDSAGKFMQELMLKRKLSNYIGGAMILTVLSGLAMYVRLTMVSDGAFASSRTGMVLGLGAIAAIAAAGVGGGVAGRAARTMAQLGEQIRTSGGPPTDSQRAEMDRLQMRQGWALRTAASLLVVTVAAMAIARYV